MFFSPKSFEQFTDLKSILAAGGVDNPLLARMETLGFKACLR